MAQLVAAPFVILEVLRLKENYPNISTRRII